MPSGETPHRLRLRLMVTGVSAVAITLAVVVAILGDDHDGRNDFAGEKGFMELMQSVAGYARPHDTSPAHYIQLFDGTRQLEPDRFDPADEHASTYVQDVGKHSKLGWHSSTGYGNPADWVQDDYHIARLAGVDTDGSASMCGRAEVRPVTGNADREWGSICAIGFTQIDAEMFCNSMGLSGGKARYTDGGGTWTWDDTAITHRDLTASHIFQRSKYGLGSTSNAPLQPDAAKIWMTQVDCAGDESNILECPFAGKAGEGTIAESERNAWIDYKGIAGTGCDESSAVGLCCDVSGFCPPRSVWTPNPYPIHQHEYGKWGTQMSPEQQYPEILANCKCDEGFFMVAPTLPPLPPRRPFLLPARVRTS
jgi:hypothetical protein